MDSNITNRKPAVFLDRDGVLTKEKSYVCSEKELEIFPYVKECIEQIKRKGYWTIVITNQSGIARGLFSENELYKMNQKLISEIGIDQIYYCPHHPEGKIERYTKKCNCRKPNIGMIEEACKEYSIDMEHSILVGDRASDILTGKNAKIRTVLVESGYGTARLESEVEPNYICQDLRDVINIL